MYPASENGLRRTDAATKDSGKEITSNTRSEWFDQLGNRLQALFGAAYCPPIVAKTYSIRCSQSYPNVTETLGNSIVQTAMSISTQQIMSYVLPISSIRPYPYPSQRSLETSDTEASLKSLLLRFSQVSHMVLTDASYKIFMATEIEGALCYKLHKDVAVICGNPLCEPNLYDRVLQEFLVEKRLSTKNIAFLGVSDNFRHFAEGKAWISLNFGVERVVNPLTNPILTGACSKRIYAQSRQLLDPKRGGMELLVYNPSKERDEQLEADMMDIYEHWRLSRESSGKVQSYLTMLNFRAYPGELFYLYAKNKDGKIHGFTGLRRLGAGQGYHLDPCIQATSAQRGVADLLVVGSMALLKSLKINSLSLGYEPFVDLSNTTGTSTMSSRILRSLYQEANQVLYLEGKRKYHDRFKPDDAQTAGLYIVLPAKNLPRIQQLLAVAGIVHLDISRVLKSRFGI